MLLVVDNGSVYTSSLLDFLYNKKFDFKMKGHEEIAENLGALDIQRAAKISGARFYFLKGDLVIEVIIGQVYDISHFRGSLIRWSRFSMSNNDSILDSSSSISWTSKIWCS